MSLEQVKTLLNTTDSRLDILYEKAERRLIRLLKTDLPEIIVVPDDLEDIVDEVTITRYNRLGAEGMTQKSVEGRSVTYQDDDFAPYVIDIQDYIEKEKGKPKPQLSKVRWY